MDQYIKSDGFCIVELKIPGVGGGQTATSFSFLDQPFLRPDVATIVSIVNLTDGSITGSPVSNGTLASISIVKTASLTLVSAGFEVVKQQPLALLNIVQNSATDPFVRQPVQYSDLRVDWTKSRVELTAAPANTADRYIVFGVYYNRIQTIGGYR